MFRQTVDAGRKIVESRSQTRRLRIDKPLRNRSARLAGMLRKGGQAGIDLIENPLVEIVQAGQNSLFAFATAAVPCGCGASLSFRIDFFKLFSRGLTEA